MKEAREDGNVYVSPRYKNIHPEGDIDPRDFVKAGQKGGGHSGGGEESGMPQTMEGKRGWTERQRAMHSTMGKKMAAKESAEGGPGSGPPKKGIGSKEDYEKWEKHGKRERTPIKAPYGEYGRKANESNWRGGGAIFQPKAPRLAESKVAIKEF